MRRFQRILLFTTSLMFLAACGNGKTIITQPPISTALPTAAPTLTADLCAEENMSTTLKPSNDLMREFDDQSQLAANLPQEQVPSAISEMQRIRREVEDLQVPPCLANLRSYELAHMNTVIETLIAFVGGASKDALTNGINRAREEHDQYSLEMARLLGLILGPNVNSTPIVTTDP